MESRFDFALFAGDQREFNKTIFDENKRERERERDVENGLDRKKRSLSNKDAVIESVV